MGLFGKKRTNGFFIVITDEVAKETYIEHIDEQEFRQNNAKYDKFARYDNEKDATKHAKDYVKHFRGWTFAKSRCRM